MKNTTTTTTTATAKVTTLCRILMNNAKFTTKFVGKSNGESLYKGWIEMLSLIKSTAYLHYIEVTKGDEKAIEESEKALYTAIKSLTNAIGYIPAKDSESDGLKIYANVLYLDAIRYAVKDDAKIEVEKLKTARENLRKAKKDYKDNCFTKDGKILKGLSPAFIDEKERAIDTVQKEIEKLLKVANNSIYGTKENSLNNFARKFEIALRKEMMKNHNFTAKEVKAKKSEKATERKTNRAKAPAKKSESIPA